MFVFLTSCRRELTMGPSHGRLCRPVLPLAPFLFQSTTAGVRVSVPSSRQFSESSLQVCFIHCSFVENTLIVGCDRVHRCRWRLTCLHSTRPPPTLAAIVEAMAGLTKGVSKARARRFVFALTCKHLPHDLVSVVLLFFPLQKQFLC